MGYKPGQECSVCKGRCCRERGCVLSPEDLKKRISADSIEEIKNYLLSDGCMFAIDMTGGSDGVFYYLRMRTKCYTFIGLEGFGECVALGKNGCELSYEDRPKGGRFLKSSPDFRCHQEYLAEEMQKDWEPYQEIFAAIWNEYAEKLESDGTISKCDRAYYEYIKNNRL